MSKGKAKTLLSLIGIVLAAIIVLTFVPFSVGDVKEYNSAVGAIELDYDIEGGAAYTFKLAEDNEENVEDVNQVIDTIEYRLDALGYSVYSIKAIKSADEDVLDYDIRVELKLSDSTSEDIKVALAYGDVRFYGGSSANPTEEILTDVKVIESSEYLGSYTDYQNNTYYQTSIVFTEEGYGALHELMHDAEKYYLEIRLGDSVLLPGTSEISESAFMNRALYVNAPNEASGKQMALQISSGGLAYKYDVEKALASAVEITSPYGENVGLKALLAVVAFVVIVMVAFILIYKGLGIASALATLVFFIAEIWMMIAVPGIVLSMGGVLGIIASIVLTVVGLILTCTRVKEEFAYSEKTVKAALNKGLSQAVVPVVNVSVISGIVAMAMLIFTKGAVKCFAITFGIGVVLSLLATLVISRMFISLLLPLAKNKEKFLDFKKEV